MNAAPDVVDQPNAELAFAGTKNIIAVTLLLVESFAEYGCVLVLGLRVYPHGKREAVVPLKVRLGTQVQEVRSIKCQALAMLARYQDRRLQLIYEACVGRRSPADLVDRHQVAQPVQREVGQ